MPPIIGYLGPKGTFTETALNCYLKKTQTQATTQSYGSILDLFNALELKQCNQIIVPSENSVEGSVNTTLDLLYKTPHITIQEEWTLPIHQTLIAKEKYPLSQITHVISHTQALAQSKQFLNKHLPQAQTHSTASTALAAKELKNNTLSYKKTDKACYAIIGNRDLAKLYSLKVLAENIQDTANNTTRFFLIGNHALPPTDNDKSSLILFPKKHKAGSLCKILQIFADQNINLTQIVSRPTQQNLGEYIFFIDCEGHTETVPLSNVLNTLKTENINYKLLGSYKKTHFK